MDILGLDSLTYGVDDLDTCRRYNEDLGLETVEVHGHGATYRTAENATVILREASDAALPPSVTPGSQLRQMVWGVASGEVLEQVGAELSKDREVTRDEDGILWTLDPMGYGLGFRVSRVEPVVDEPPQVNVLGRPVRINTRHRFVERPRILHLGHVVFHVPNLQETYDFYTKRLGFKLSDTYPNVGYFMRCAGSHDHHNLFLLHFGEFSGLNHVSYAVCNVDEVAMAGQHMERSGWSSHTGPGRHVIGSNYFWYFENPCGGMIEYHADMDYLTDEWVPREWEFTPEVAAAWDRGPGFH